MNENENVENETVETKTVNETKTANEAQTVGTKVTRNRVAMDDFIETWEEVALGDNPSVARVANLLGLEETSVQQRAAKYRNKNGIPLTKIRANGAKFDTEAAMNKLEEVRARIKAKQAEAEAKAEVESEEITAEVE